jgi:hypothetical protein
MFPPRYFGRRYFPGRYFGVGFTSPFNSFWLIHLNQEIGPTPQEPSPK